MAIARKFKNLYSGNISLPNFYDLNILEYIHDNS